MEKEYVVNIEGYEAHLPIIPISPKLAIAFFNLHGNQKLTEHCGKAMVKYVKDCDVLITAESKGLQLTHVIARELGQDYYAVARKSKKLYMQDGIEIAIDASITTGKEQHLYLSKHDVELIKGKKVGIIDDVVSTGASLKGLEDLVTLAGGTVYKKAFVLAESTSATRKDINYLGVIPIFPL